MVDQNGWTWNADDTGKDNGTPPNAGSWDAGKGNAGGAWDGGGEDKDKKKDDPTIPKYRFDEVNGKLKTTEEELAKYREKEAKEEEKKKKDQGKYEEIITTKEAEIAALKETVSQVEFLTSTVESMVNAQLAEMQASVGDEKMKTILSLVGYDTLNITGKVESLGKIKQLVAELSPPKKPDDKNVGWSWIGGGKPNDWWNGGGGKTTFASMLQNIVKTSTTK